MRLMATLLTLLVLAAPVAARAAADDAPCPGLADSAALRQWPRDIAWDLRHDGLTPLYEMQLPRSHFSGLAARRAVTEAARSPDAEVRACARGLVLAASPWGVRAARAHALDAAGWRMAEAHLYAEQALKARGPMATDLRRRHATMFGATPDASVHFANRALEDAGGTAEDWRAGVMVLSAICLAEGRREPRYAVGRSKIPAKPFTDTSALGDDQVAVLSAILATAKIRCGLAPRPDGRPPRTFPLDRLPLAKATGGCMPGENTVRFDDGTSFHELIVCAYMPDAVCTPVRAVPGKLLVARCRYSPMKDGTAPTEVVTLRCDAPNAELNGCDDDAPWTLVGQRRR